MLYSTHAHKTHTHLCVCFSPEVSFHSFFTYSTHTHTLQWIFTCSELDKLPNVGFVINGHTFELTPNEYVLKVRFFTVSNFYGEVNFFTTMSTNVDGQVENFVFS